MPCSRSNFQLDDDGGAIFGNCRWIGLVLSALLAAFVVPANVHALQTGSATVDSGSRLEFVPDETSKRESGVELVRVGFDGRLKLGHFSPVTIYLGQELEATPPDSFELICRDGDDIRVAYSGNLKLAVLPDGGKSNAVQGWIRPGRNGGPIGVRLLRGGEVVSEFEVPVESGTVKNIPATQPLVVVIHENGKLAELIRDSASASDAPEVVNVADSAELPLTSFGYDGVNTVVLPSSTELPPAQFAALSAWVRDGGDLVLVAQNGFDFSNGINELLPGTMNGTVDIGSSGLERLAKTDQQMVKGETDRLQIARLEPMTGIAVLEEEQSPLIIRQASGLGQVSLVTIDLMDDQVSGWIGTGALIRMVMNHGGERTLSSRVSNRVESSSLLHSGYKDLSGQLRAPLDQFRDVKFVSFTVVALLIGLFILCAGPGDFFLLKKIGRMEFTWITLGLMTAAFCALAWFTQRSMKPDKIRINQVEIIDIDVQSHRARGTVWANLYCPETGAVDIRFTGKSSIGIAIDSDLMTWHGLPGDGLGGMQTKSTASLIGQQYTNRISDNIADLSGESNSLLESIPLQVASSRSIYGRWSGTSVYDFKSQLTFDLEKSRTAQLKGTLKNSLDVPLVNCRIMFREWVYVIDGPLVPGEPIAIGLGDTQEKSLDNYFTRRVQQDDKGVVTAWDPNDTDLSRVTDVMMFYDLAGGYGFTGLTSGYQTHVDLSHLPILNRAVLVGEIAVPATPLEIGGQSSADSYDKQLTIVRIVLPVDTSKN